MLNERQRNLLQFLIKKSTPTKMGELADFYNVSERTMRNDVNEVEYFVSSFQADIHRDKSQGILINLKEADKHKIFHSVQDIDEFHVRLSPLERMMTILGMLFQTGRPVNSKEMAALMHVTRRTVLEDVKKLSEFLQPFHVDVEYENNKGFLLKGTELNIRRSYKQLSNQFGDEKTLEWLTQHMEDSSEDIEQLRKELLSLLQQSMPELTDLAMQGIIIHVVLAMQRLKQEKTITFPDIDQWNIRTYKEFEIGKKIVKLLEAKLDKSLCEDEAAFITLHLLSSKTLQSIETDEDHRLLALIKKMVAKISFQSGIDFMDDVQLEQGLLVHLKPAIYRLQFQLGLNNPMTDQIMEEYSRLSQWVEQNLNEIEEEYNVAFNIDEVCFLTLHFGAATERMESRSRMRVLLVCGSGIGTVQLMKSRLKRLFPEIIVDRVISYFQLHQERELSEVDYIFSTMPIENIDLPSIMINPMINETDQQKITDVLIKKQERKSGPVLEKVLKPEYIQLDIPAENWKEAIRIGSTPLVENQLIEPKYIEAMIQMVTDNGPYVVLDEGVAMPHAKPEEGVNELCLSFLRLSNSVNFGHESNDPVKLIFCLGSTDAETHLRALRQLVTALNEKESKDVFLKGSKEEIWQVINKASLQ